MDFLRYIFKLGIKTIILIVILIGLFLIAVRVGVFGKLPNVDEYKKTNVNIASEIYSADSTLIGKYYVDNRTDITYNEISPWLIKALLSYSKKHNISKSIAYMVYINAHRSTYINRFVLPLKIIFTEMMINNRYSEAEKNTVFLNNFDFTYNAYGIASASRIYFNKKAKDLDINEAATFVAMLDNPSYFNPKNHPVTSLNKKAIILQQMYDMNYISKNEYDSLKFKPAKLNFYQEPPNSGIAPYFRMVLAEYLKNWSKENKKPDGSNYNIYTDGLKIYTTINIKMQQYAEAAAIEHLTKYQKILDAQFRSGWTPWKTEKGKKILLHACKYTDRWQKLKSDGLDDEEIFNVFSSEKVKMKLFTYNGLVDTILTPIDSIKYYKSFLQVGCMSMETQTGFVRAWVGGANFDYFKVDHCNINTKRQVGSLFKSIVYTSNIQNGHPICDLKRSFTKSTGKVSSYLLNNISILEIIDLSRQLGIVSDLPPYTFTALGAAGVSLYEMMQVYSTFPNAGYNIKPQFLLSIKDKYGKDIYRFKEERKRVVSDTVASKMIYLMKKVVDSAGTGASLKQRFDLKDIQIAGKTGTTNKYTDAWFIGFTPEVITGVWVGCDDPLIHLLYESNGQGAAAAMPVFGLFLNKIYNDKNLGFNKKLNFFVSKDSSLLNISCNDL